MSAVMGYDANQYVQENYVKLAKLILQMREGELVDLVGSFQVDGQLKEDKAREYVFGAVCKRWVEISNHGAIISTLEAKRNMKHLRPVHFNADKRKILEFIESVEAEKQQREAKKSESETPFTDAVRKEKEDLKKARQMIWRRREE